NVGQMPGFPKGAIVETNAIFSDDCVVPVLGKELPRQVKAMIYPHIFNLETVYQGIKKRDLKQIFSGFINDPLCGKLSLDEAKALFKEMVRNTKEYLYPYFELDNYLE
ncbi:MAG: alpha-glucosidase/alpha-galactosidase, partial [Bacilli bacterium]|nr:alpha-glucosidase/alpha-galactosidase [Bacilli bacterium]